MKSDQPHPALDKLRELTLSLPETAEVIAWEHPTFRVKNKIFASFGSYGGGPSIGCKQTKIDQSVLVEDPRISVAPYVGKHGWITIQVENMPWPMIEQLVLQSYRLIAPKRLAQALDDDAPSPKKAAPRRKA